MQEEIAEALRSALDAKRLAIWQFAKRMGVAPDTASRWLSGSQGMTLPNVLRAYRILRDPRILEAHPVGRALIEARRSTVADLDSVRALRGEPVLVRALRYPDGRIEPVGDPVPWLPDETPPPAAPVAVAA